MANPTSKTTYQSLFSSVLDHLWLTVDYFLLGLTIAALIETLFIFPPQHSYNIGPPFFFLLGGSIVLFIPVALFLALVRLIRRYIFFNHWLTKIVFSFFAVLGLLLWLDNYQPHLSIPNLPNIFLAGVIELAANLAFITSPYILNHLVFTFLHKKFSLKKWHYTLLLTILTLLSIEVWWEMMGYFEIGKY
jgi:hypothetical protein